MLIIGQKTLGLSFREQLTISENGLSHKGVTVPWSKVRRVKITHFKEARKRWWWCYILFLEYIQWDKMTIETESWSIVLDSRVTVRPDDERKYALGNFEDKIDSRHRVCKTPAFLEVKKVLEGFCPDKIVNKTAFAGSFDFSEKTSWVGLVLVLLLIGFILAIICNAARPLFR